MEDLIANISCLKIGEYEDIRRSIKLREAVGSGEHLLDERGVSLHFSVDVGIIEKVLLPEDRRQNGLSYKFYGVSESGRQFLEEHKLLRAQDTLREIYDRVEKTEDIKRYETAPRPER
ncbi:hypothetical protein [Halobacterium sp. CBA1126]|uniref:hypothetical protein n=1 Tax=Halobacterium sp. CBA1126 TaxID=2668074 RepID=UPI0037425DE6